jgi:hypothetical protein
MQTPVPREWKADAGHRHAEERLARVTGSPVVEVNRAVALGMAYGQDAGLTLLDQLEGLPALSGYHLAQRLSPIAECAWGPVDKLGRLTKQGRNLREQRR